MDDINRPPTYKEEVTQYTKKDAIHALLFFTAIVFSNLLVRVIPVLPMGYNVNLVFVSIQLVMLFVILKKKGQGLRSVGIHAIDWRKVLCAGLVFAVACLMLFNGIISGLFEGWQLRDPVALTGIIAATLLLAFYEDVFFVGYCQTRIYGLIKKDWLAIALGAFLFASIHWPYWIMVTLTSGNEHFVDYNWVSFAMHNVMWIVFYILLSTIFRHLRSIIPVVLFHLSYNLAMGNRGGLWLLDSYEVGGFIAVSFGIVFSLVMLAVWWISPQRKKRNEAK